MWIKKDGRLIHTTDVEREFFRTTISKNLLETLNTIAEDNNTYVNYIFDNGIKNLFKSNPTDEDVEKIRGLRWNKTKDRIRYGSNYDRMLLNKAKTFCKKNKLQLNAFLEHSANFVVLEEVKEAGYRSRIVDCDK